MIKESIETVVNMGIKAHAPKQIAHPKNNQSIRAHEVFQSVNPSTGEILENISITPRAIRCTSIGGFTGALMDFVNDDEMGKHATRVYVGQDDVVALLDERGDRKDEISMNLKRSAAFDVLLGGGIESDQADLIWMLRTVFADAISDDTFLPSLRSMRFNSSRSSGTSVQHGKETKDASIEREIAAGDGGTILPENITFTVPVYECLRGLHAVKIECAVHVDLINEEIIIKPMGGQIECAIDESLQAIAHLIDKALAETSANYDRCHVIHGARP